MVLCCLMLLFMVPGQTTAPHSDHPPGVGVAVVHP